MSKRPILKLNASFMPLGVSCWKDIIVNIFSGTAHPLDIWCAQNKDGTYGELTIETFVIIKDWKECVKLPIRPVDDFVHTNSGPVRLPSVVIASRFNRVIYRSVQFPTKHNIFKRDKYTCGYSGRKLQKHELSVDHILLASRGGDNTWENLITCAKEINTFKDNRLPHKCGLALLWKPEKPTKGLVFNNAREDWTMFLNY
jgi:5-methylcytosine-specific restriction endonuclease McrA